MVVWIDVARERRREGGIGGWMFGWINERFDRWLDTLMIDGCLDVCMAILMDKWMIR